jgi:hypothetical protein
MMPSLILLTRAELHALSDAELLMTHLRAHQQAHNILKAHAAPEDMELTPERLTEVHRWLVETLQQRQMNHHMVDGLDETLPVQLQDISLRKFGPTVRDVHIDGIVDEEKPKLPHAVLKVSGDTVLVPGFVQIVGSSAEPGSDPKDLDVLVRADMGKDGRYYEVQAESLLLAVRKTVTPNKDKELHILGHPQGPHQGTAISLADLVLRWHEPQAQVVKSETLDWDLDQLLKAQDTDITPGKRYTLMKPSMAGVTEYFAIDKLKPWAATRYPVYASPKIDGFRAVLSYDGHKLSVWFEDAGVAKNFPITLKETQPFVIEGEFTATQNGKPLARTELAGVAAGKTKATPKFYLYDLLFHGKGGDVHARPFTERLKLLRTLSLPKANFIILDQRKLTSDAELAMAGKWAAAQPQSEGMYVRQDVGYTFGPTMSSAKLKVICEIKCIVLDKKENKAGSYNYLCGLRVEQNDDFPNIQEFDGQKYLVLGWTFNTPF